jgi:hypothetical protein
MQPLRPTMRPVSITTTTEAIMSTSIPKQHPSVVLRSQYDHMKALLAVCLAVVAALATSVVLVATDDNDPAGADKRPGALGVGSLGAAGAMATSPKHEIALRRSTAVVTVPGSARYDGGPDEGTRGPTRVASPTSTRFDGGPDEGTRGIGH